MFQVSINRRVFNISLHFNFNKFLVPKVFAISKISPYR